MAERAFDELNPRCVAASLPGGSPLRLSFDCPACGPPYRIDIPIILNGQGEMLRPEMKKWVVTTPDLSWGRTTINPSINNTPGGHGRKKPCPWHGTVTDGIVRPA